MFVLYGRLRELARTDLSAVNWKALSDFKLAFEVAAKLKIPPAVQFLGMTIPEGFEKQR